MAGLIIHPVAASQTPGNIIFSQVGHYKVTFAPLHAATQACTTAPNAIIPGVMTPAVRSDGRMCPVNLQLDNPTPDTRVVYALIGYASESIWGDSPHFTQVQQFFQSFNLSFNGASVGTFPQLTNTAIPIGNNRAMQQYTNVTELVQTHGSGSYRIENQVANPNTASGQFAGWVQAHWPGTWILVVQEDPTFQNQVVVINDFLHITAGDNYDTMNVDVQLPAGLLAYNQYSGSTGRVRSFGGSWGFGTTEDYDMTYTGFNASGEVTGTGDLGNFGGVFAYYAWGQGADVEVTADTVRINFHAYMQTDGPELGAETTSMLVYEIPVYDLPAAIVTDTCYDEDD
jgi:hypothetical protein